MQESHEAADLTTKGDIADLRDTRVAGVDTKLERLELHITSSSVPCRCCPRRIYFDLQISIALPPKYIAKFVVYSEMSGRKNC